MRAAEILRKLADIVDANEGNDTATDITNRPGTQSIEVDHPTDTSSIEAQAEVNTKSMVAPLQQKLDLMKKMAGVEGPCTSCGCDPCECEEPEDEMSIMKRNAGIPVFTIIAADEDEPFEG
jgi:hypothetical protein